ncbi:hypothetical protein BX666DRAFT_1865257, partial [Dichotomocladium elegans]
LTKEDVEEFILQKDGASRHTGGYASWWNANIKDFDFGPAQSSYLNRIDHFWDI